MPASQPSLISTLPPSRVQRRAALASVLLLLAFFAIALRYANVYLPQIDVFMPIFGTVLFITDCITAALLFAQFSVLRSAALLILATGYLFTGLLVVPYTLSFPGAFAPGGLLGAGMQTTVWLYTIWHVGLPATVIGYALLRDAGVLVGQATVRKGILGGIALAFAFVLVATWFVTAQHDHLPVLMANLKDSNPAWRPIAITITSLCAIAVVLMWRRRGRSLLDLWLLVVAIAWLLDSTLVNFNTSRWQVAWYANRGAALVAACVVLLVLLAESTMLYARLALSVLAQRSERQGRLMSMDAMLAAIEHEMRQPLAAIVANANAGRRWLDRDAPDVGEAREAFESIAADGRRSSDVLHSVRAMFGKDDQATTTRFDMNDLIRETMLLVRGELQSRRVAVELDLAPQVMPVTAHWGQMQQVILNLAGNAADAMRDQPDGRAVLAITSGATDSSRVEVTVSDSGTGIDPAIRERIFDAFFTTKPAGMGMGLAICRSIVEAHGGTLSVSDRVPRGSVFRIVLPAPR